MYLIERISFLLIAFYIALLFSDSVTLDNNVIPEPYLCRLVNQPVTINGYLNEWGDFKQPYGKIYIEDPYADRITTDRNKIWCRLAWDSKNIYLSFLINDTKLMARTLNNDDYILDDDGIEVFLCRKDDSTKTWSPDVFHIFFGLNNNVTQKQGIVPVSGKGRVQQMLIHELNVHSYMRPLGTINDNSDIDTGYQLEASISWESLGMTPSNGTTFRFNFAVNEWDDSDNDTSQATHTTVYYLYSGVWADPHNNFPFYWRSIILDGVVQPSLKKATPSISSISRSGSLIFVIVPFIILVAFAYLIYIRQRSQAISTKLRNEIDFKLKNFIDDNFKKKVSLEDFCKQYNLGLRQVQRWIKKDLNTTFNDLLTRRRMTEAIQMLEMTSKSISEICFEVGYSDTSYFTKIFKNIHGTAPTDVRKRFVKP